MACLQLLDTGRRKLVVNLSGIRTIPSIIFGAVLDAYALTAGRELVLVADVQATNMFLKLVPKLIARVEPSDETSAGGREGKREAAEPDRKEDQRTSSTEIEGDLCRGRMKMAWTEDMIQKVWEKGHIVVGNDPAKWRKDECGAWIGRSCYGNRNSQYGWEIDHISPDGQDTISNLRPLQWQNNVDKSDGRLKCNVKASGKDNVAE